jgi:hypothetical protein
MKQAGTETAKQGIAQAAKQTGVEAAKQTGVEAAKQGIFSANPAGMPPTAGAPITPAGPATPLAPAGNAPQMTLEQQLAQIKNNPTDLSKFPKYEPVATGPGGQTPLVEKAAADPLRTTYSTYPSQTYNPATGGVDNVMRTTSTPPFNAANAPVTNAPVANAPVANAPINTPPADPSQSFAPFKSNIPSQGPVPEFMSPQTALPKGAPYNDPGTLARAASDQGIAQMNTAPTSELMLKPTYAEQFPLAPESPLAKGAREAFEWMGNNKLETGLAAMTVGQYMNKPEEEDKDKYKNTVDMSGFEASEPTQRSFTPSYEYQKYAVGGPVEQMSAMNSMGANTGYPMSGINTPVYSNPMMQRPEATNVLAPSADAGVSAYSGEPRYAEGGISAAERREYGLSTRGQRASRNLSKSYEEMEEARQKEAMKLFGERSDPGIVPRSRTQMMSSPFSAAQAEHARLGKKAKVPVVEMPKTNLGDIDNYMDIPIEAAGGGIMHGLGGYSDGGRLLKGPGDGVSDSIPAVIGKRQPARLADGEFVIPARIVSELGNGSTEAGARKLYAMMERVQASRKKSIGKKKVAVNSKADKHLPA